MEHPRYAKGDPKEGQPVLVGDTFYDNMGSKHLCRGFSERGDIILAWRDGYASNSAPWSFYSPNGTFFSTPPAPAIEACVCGSAHHIPDACGDGDPDNCAWYVTCYACGRRGPWGAERTKSAAISPWNADMRKLKGK